ncbi:hypothetical protein [Leptolyngbya sp. FACHB-261]|uniref:hypothetical protein n=1 Tax=Leptolyngbya sp. FACHB-261 TaxID=2692806 RepID=UPI00168728B5|nr:hypothetical protein [Leptolyngbya sp. FACHB-261]MBD2099388.1 hypothetical protein [Leptolyngbya sp. FACHB-261]
MLNSQKPSLELDLAYATVSPGSPLDLFQTAIHSVPSRPDYVERSRYIQCWRSRREDHYAPIQKRARQVATAAAVERDYPESVFGSLMADALVGEWLQREGLLTALPDVLGWNWQHLERPVGWFNIFWRDLLWPETRLEQLRGRGFDTSLAAKARNWLEANPTPSLNAWGLLCHLDREARSLFLEDLFIDSSTLLDTLEAELVRTETVSRLIDQGLDWGGYIHLPEPPLSVTLAPALPQPQPICPPPVLPTPVRVSKPAARCEENLPRVILVFKSEIGMEGIQSLKQAIRQHGWLPKTVNLSRGCFNDYHLVPGMIVVSLIRSFGHKDSIPVKSRAKNAGARIIETRSRSPEIICSLISRELPGCSDAA